MTYHNSIQYVRYGGKHRCTTCGEIGYSSVVRIMGRFEIMYRHRTNWKWTPTHYGLVSDLEEHECLISR